MIGRRSARLSDRMARVLNPATASAPADVCLVVEGCYPYISGGVSSWVDWLLRAHPNRRFAIVALLATPSKHPPRYTLPDNVVDYREVILSPEAKDRLNAETLGADALALGTPLIRFTEVGGLHLLSGLLKAMEPLIRAGVDANRFVRSREAYTLASSHYAQAMPGASFIDFYWGWRSMVQSIYATLSAPIPPARLYHSISTGYAGLYQSRACLETNQPGIVTEHGIYTNERRMEIMLATWIRKGLRRRLSVRNDIPDIDAFWASTFEALSRTCYEVCDRITTLYGDNSLIQASDGAPADKRLVIPNGVDTERFADLPRPAADVPPTVALIGRVTPIKDIKTFIRSVDLMRRREPDIRALVIGPTDEDPAYFAECQALVERLKLGDTLTFTGMANIRDWLPQIHVMALSSLSEAQPLTILEGGAAGIPFVTTDVGACREMLLGRPSEDPQFGPGGILVGLIDPDALANAVLELLADPDRMNQYGANLRRRIEHLYRADVVSARYDGLYRDLAA